MQIDQTPGKATPDAPQSPAGPDESRRMMAAFGEIVTLMTRSARYRHTFLAELEWLVGPAIATRQYSVAETQPDAASVAMPVAAIMWACVSPEVDARLSDARERPRLRPTEWRSGQIPWLIETIGDPKAAAILLKRLVESRFADTGVKTMVQSDGKFKVEVARSGAVKREAATGDETREMVGDEAGA
jgi:hemolysin-activating ACP:hemolysin acyltransferase